MKSWQEVQPSVDRLVAIESELNVLISQLNTLVMEAEEEDKKIAKSQPKKAVASYSKKAKAVVSPRDKNYSLQLASIASPDKVEQSWLDILKSSAGRLGGEQPLIQVVQIKNKAYYRIKVGRYSSKQAAQKECNQLKGNNIDCIVAAYSAQTLSDFLLGNRSL